jgi:hypothetical protein
MTILWGISRNVLLLDIGILPLHDKSNIDRWNYRKHVEKQLSSHPG